MKTTIQKSVMLLAVALLGFNCDPRDVLSEFDACGNESWSERTGAEADALAEATVAFSNSPSKGTCENVRTALFDYIEVLEDMGECVVPANRDAYAKALDDSRVQLQELDCDEDFQS